MQDERGLGVTTVAVGKAEPKPRYFRPRKFACEQLGASVAGEVVLAWRMPRLSLVLLCPASLPLESVGSVNHWGSRRA